MTHSDLPAYLDALTRLIQPVRATDFPRPLEPMQRLLAALDHPEQAFEPIVIAGSVGKGTACIQIAGMLGRAGAGTVGLYTGPHLHTFRERFVVEGETISYREFIAGAAAVEGAAAGLPDRYSTFEMATALALWWFRERGVRRAVLEIGIGGRYDAVNAVPNRLAVILPIEMEHAAMLGGTLASIAAHKAGIIQPGGTVISVEQVPAVEAVIQAEAAAKAATLHLVPAEALVGVVEGLMIPEPGNTDEICHARWAMDSGRIRASSPVYPPLRTSTLITEDGRQNSSGTPNMASASATGLPGRLEVIERGGKQIVIDGAHTARSARRLRDYVDTLTGDTVPMHLVAGVLRDKAPAEVLAPFDSTRFNLTLTTAPGHRALPAAELASLCGLTAARVTVIESLEAGLARLSSEPQAVQVVMGSLRMAAAARESLGLLSAEALAEAQATRSLFEGEGYLGRLK